MGWTLEGSYFESCNCETTCPCIFLSAPTQGECTVLVGWHITKGSDDAVSLDGLNVMLMVHTPGKMHEVKWTAAVYIDERADAAQRQ